MNAEIISFFSKTPYSIPHVIGFFLVIQAVVFFEVSQRSKDRYSRPLSLGLLLLAIAWGTTDYQNAGKIYVDWNWWWAQPFFALGIFFMSLGVTRYLPLDEPFKKILLNINGIFAFGYLILGTSLLLLDFQIPRLFIVWMQMPPFFAICFSTLKAEKNEPKKGHRLIGLLAITIPILTILFPILGLKTAVLRFWTAIPLITLSSIVLAVSLLRDREKIQENLNKLKIAEDNLIEANKDLEIKVLDRTAMLHEIITDLEAFNRNVSHDLRSPLGSISLTAEVAEKYLENGNTSYVATELLSIKDQVASLQTLVSTMLNLAAGIDKELSMSEINFTDYVNKRVQKIELQFSRKFPNVSVPHFSTNGKASLTLNVPLLNIVIDNLVENAIKYNLGRSGLIIEIGCTSFDGKFLIYVKDNGVGIHSNDKSLIFNPFIQGSLGEKLAIAGYGLGLNIVERAVKKMGGRVWHEETAGGGATFKFSLDGSRSLA
jgi:signal transduction histidine kinase